MRLMGCSGVPWRFLGGPLGVQWSSLVQESLESLGEFLDAVASLATRELPVKNVL